MKDQMRFIISLLLLIGILALYPVYLKWVSPPKPAPVQQTMEMSGEQRVESREPEKIPEKAAASPALSSQPFDPAQGKPAALGYKEELYDLDNKYLSVTFSTLGGSIKHLEAKTYAPLHKETATLIDIDKGLRGSYALTFPLEKAGAEQIEFKRDKSLETNGNTIAFSAIKDGKVKIAKLYELLDAQSAIRLTVHFENLSELEQTLNAELSTQLYFTDTESSGQDQSSIEAGCRLLEKVESGDLGKISKKGFLKEGSVGWIFASKKYFALISDPGERPFERTRSIRLNANEIVNFALLAPLELAPRAKETRQFLLYAGPKEYTLLKSYKRDYQTLLSKGFIGLFRIWLLLALQFIYHWVPNWGWAIVVITCLIKIAFTPLTHMSYASMRKMQHLQPKIKAIQEKYKKEPQKMNKEVMGFYKKHKVNPMGGCLPLVLQMPIFIAFYQVLYQAIELKGAPWIFWVTDLSAPDKLFTLSFSLPFIGDGINILPLLMVGSMVWQQQLTPMPSTSPEQAKVMAFMPVIFGFFFYNLPSGLVLYWTVNNFLTIFHQLFIQKYLPHPQIAD